MGSSNVKCIEGMQMCLCQGNKLDIEDIAMVMRHQYVSRRSDIRVVCRDGEVELHIRCIDAQTQQADAPRLRFLA